MALRTADYSEDDLLPAGGSRGNRRKSALFFVALSILIAFFVCLTFLWQKNAYDNLLIAARDLAFFDQSAYNAAHGKGLRTTIGTVGDHLFSEHLYLTHYTFVPLYKFFAHPYILLAASSVSLSLGALAFYFLGQSLGLPPLLRLLVTALFLTHPSTHSAVTGGEIYGYHPDTWFPLLFFLAYAAHLRERALLFSPLVAISLCTAEQHAVSWLSFAAYLFVSRQRIKGLLLGSAAVAYFLLATMAIIPHFSSIGHPYYFVAWTLQDLSRVPDALRALVLDAGVLTFGLAGLPFFHPLSLVTLPTLAVYVKAFLANYTVPLSPLSWHTMTLLPVFAAAGARFLSRVWRRITPRGQKFAVAIIIITLLGNVGVTWRIIYYPIPERLSPERLAALKRVQALVPPEAPLSATLFVASHFAHRENLYLLPAGIDKSDYVLVDTRQRWGLGPKEQKALKRLKTAKGFGVLLDEAGFLLFKREIPFREKSKLLSASPGGQRLANTSDAAGER